jgi:hypothetical protein
VFRHLNRLFKSMTCGRHQHLNDHIHHRLQKWRSPDNYTYADLLVAASNYFPPIVSTRRYHFQLSLSFHFIHDYCMWRAPPMLLPECQMCSSLLLDTCHWCKLDESRSADRVPVYSSKSARDVETSRMKTVMGNGGSRLVAKETRQVEEGHMWRHYFVGWTM